MRISKKLAAVSFVAVLVVSGASVYAVNNLDFSSKADTWVQANCNEKQLNQKKADVNDAVCHNTQQIANNDLELEQQNNLLQTLSGQQSSQATMLDEQQDSINELESQLANYQAAPPTDFAFFTNYGVRYGNYVSSPVFDAGQYSNYSMTFTCTTNNNDKIKYWIETSTDAVNWSPTGYYEVNCNGSYGGASLNQGLTSARYYQVVVFQLANNNNTNTINSFARFSN